MNTRASHPELISERTRLPERRVGLSLKLAAIVGIGSAALVGCASQAPDLVPPPSTTTSESSGSTPEASATPEQELTVEALEIPATLSPEAAVTILVEERLSTWAMVGASEATLDAYLQSSSVHGFFDALSEANAPQIADALFIPGWKDDESLARYVDWSTEKNARSVEAWVLTSGSGLPQDIEPYERSINLDSVTVVGEQDGTTRVTVEATEHDNADRNSVGPGERIEQSTPLDGNRIIGDITLQQIDGAWKIAAIAWSARE